MTPHLDFYLAYNFFRMAAILQGIVGRVRDGTAANANAPTMAAQVRPLAETAWRFAESATAVKVGVNHNSGKSRRIRAIVAIRVEVSPRDRKYRT